MPDNEQVPDPIDDAARELYAVFPDEFMARRTELTDAARKNGDAALAQAIAKLRKPTVGAWLVNALVNDDPSLVDKLTELGERMRAAQDALDAAKLRELSVERRKLVNSLTANAFRRAKRKDPPAALRDEVTGTLDAAIADAHVAMRLGRLQRAEQWSGFGFLPTGAPELTLVRGGRDESRKKQPTKPKISPAERRKHKRALDAARAAFDTADREHQAAKDSERDLAQHVRQLIKKLSKLQDQLDGARADLEAARKEVGNTRDARRTARSALDRAERETPG